MCELFVLRAQMNKWTGLHWAVHRRHAAIVKHLMANGADPTVRLKKLLAPLFPPCFSIALLLLLNPQPRPFQK